MAAERELYEVVWPRGNRVDEGGGHAKRLGFLEGKTIGELWNGVFRGNEIFPLVEKEMARRYPGIRFVKYDVFGSTGGGEGTRVVAVLPDKLKQSRVDAVISGVGC